MDDESVFRMLSTEIITESYSWSKYREEEVWGTHPNCTSRIKHSHRGSENILKDWTGEWAKRLEKPNDKEVFWET